MYLSLVRKPVQYGEQRLPRSLLLSFVVVLGLGTYGQVNITTGSYFQNFGTTDITSWTDNATYLGWYRSSGPFAGHVNITSAPPVNTGGFYTYECNGNNNQKIGSRASGGTGATNIRYGVVLRNQTGFPIQSIKVTYRGYQLSLAQNGSVPNTITFDYVTSASLPGITAGATATVPALDFAQVANSSTAGSAQILGYPCTQSRSISACFSLATPLAVNSYILLRWTDIDDTNNDHHMAIDDLQVDFDLTGTVCSLLLPIELLHFGATPNGAHVELDWATASERDNSHFVVHRGSTPFDLVPVLQHMGAGTTQHSQYYTDMDPSPLPGVSYYRLQQVDLDGNTSWSEVVAVRRVWPDTGLRIFPNPSADGRFVVLTPEEVLVVLDVYDGSGRLVEQHSGAGGTLALDLTAQPAGAYVVRCVTASGQNVTQMLQKVDGTR